MLKLVNKRSVNKIAKINKIIITTILILIGTFAFIACGNGTDGLTPHIGENGNWWVGTTDLGVPAQGEQGEQGQQGQQGQKGQKGQKGESAYDLFIKYNPDYLSSEEQWVEDLANGRLAKLSVTFRTDGFDDVVLYVFYNHSINESDIPQLPQKENYFGKWEDFDFTNIKQSTIINAIYKPTTQGLSYTLINNDTEYAVSGIGTATDTDIVIPSSYNNKRVTSIEFEAFVYSVNLTSITIPNSVTTIGEFAFYYCTSLASITIPNSVTSIGEFAFASCTSLASITIPNSVTSIGNGAFASCTSLISITIPNSVTSIGDYAFANCTSLASITIPNSVTSIGDYAFAYCTNLTIFCKAESKPDDWNSNWNISNCPVEWGYEG